MVSNVTCVSVNETVVERDRRRLESVSVTEECYTVWNPTAGLGYPKISPKFSTAVKSNSVPTILGPFFLAHRDFDDWRELVPEYSF